jgi:outer membrane protein assembly factor BamB
VRCAPCAKSLVIPVDRLRSQCLCALRTATSAPRQCQCFFGVGTASKQTRTLASGPIAVSATYGTPAALGGALASWQDAQGTRWIAAPSSRGIATFKLAEQDGTLALQPAWTSRDIPSPLPPLAVNGLLFAASSGTRTMPSALYAIDAATGKDLWNSGKAIAAVARGGLSAGQGNVYVPGADGTLYAFGFAIEK